MLFAAIFKSGMSLLDAGRDAGSPFSVEEVSQIRGTERFLSEESKDSERHKKRRSGNVEY